MGAVGTPNEVEAAMQAPALARGTGSVTPRQRPMAARAELPGQTNNVVALSRSPNSIAVSPFPSPSFPFYHPHAAGRLFVAQT